MVDTLDLDALLPEPKKIVLHGKSLDVLPLTIGQLIILAKLEAKLMSAKQPDDFKTLVLDALKPVIPELNDVNFTIDQLKAIQQFVQKASLPETKTAKEFEPKKKVDSAEASPTSPTSTPPTK